MKLSLIVPTFRSASTIERTLRSVLAQAYRPLEVVVYDETSQDGTREIVARLLADAHGSGIETRFTVSEENSGPVKAWRVPLHQATGDWCCFVWADDVLEPTFSERMMEGAGRAVTTGRKLVFCCGTVEADGRELTKYAADAGILTPVEFSLGIFLRRFSLNQVNGVYETEAARNVFDRHVQFENPMGYDYNRFPYGNDAGFLSELAAEGGGMELIGERLVRLVLSENSMTRDALASRLWQMRWQYTFNQLRVWGWWRERGVPGADFLVEMAGRRLALCEFMLEPSRRKRTIGNAVKAVLAGLDFFFWDHERRPLRFDEFRNRVARRYR